MAHPPRALPTSRPDRPAGFANVLVVAENEGHARIDRDFLKKARVFGPRVVFSARAAQAALERHGADLIICDGRLADTDGLAFAAWLKRQPGLKTIPVIMASVENRREAVLEAAGLGLCGYMIRPYSEATFARYLALARAMRDFTADAAAALAKARRCAEEAAPNPEGEEVRDAPGIPDEAPRHYRLGLRRLAESDYDGAAAAFSRATALNALYVEAHLGLAEAWRAKGDERRYREAMKRAAEACARARRLEELRDRFVELLKKDRQGFNPFFALGNESQRARDYAGAVIAYREALALTPDKGDIYIELGKAYHFLRRRDLAVRAVTRGLALCGEHAEAQALLTRLTGRDPDALETMEEAVTARADTLPWAVRVACRVAGMVTEGLYRVRRLAA